MEGMASSVDEEGVSRPAGAAVDSAGIMTDGERWGGRGCRGGGGVEEGASHTPRKVGEEIMTDGERGSVDTWL